MTVTHPSVFSERPGFTLIGGSPTSVGPIVTRLDGSRDSFFALRAAVGHAMTRTCGMVVLDETGRWDMPFETDVVDDRERSVVQGILGNDHVTRVSADPPGLEEALRRTREMDASLLVLSPRDVVEATASPTLLAGLLEAPYDVLMLTAATQQS